MKKIVFLIAALLLVLACASSKAVVDTEKDKLDLISLFTSFYTILKPSGKAIFQFYPKTKATLDEIGEYISKNTKFKGNFVIDNPNNPKKRKIFLILQKDKL